MSEAQVSGRYVKAFLKSAGDVSSVFERKASNILESNGISDVDAEEWYDLANFVDAVNDIEEEVGEKTSEQAGTKMIEIVDEVSNMDSIEETIEIGKTIIRQSYRNYSLEMVGDFEFDELDNGNQKISLHGGWRYPEAFTDGIAKGLVESVNGLTSSDMEKMETEKDEAYAYEIYQ